MIQWLKKRAKKIFNLWIEEEIRVFSSLLEFKPGSSLIDLGCGDGERTLLFAQKCQASQVVGVDAVVPKDLKPKGLKVVPADLNRKLPFTNNSFDVVTSHFALEHLYNSGLFIKETKRILKKGGYTVVATDNLSTWPNIFSLFMGWQPFSTTSGIVNKKRLGNPLAVGSSLSLENESELGKLAHNKVMAYQLLLDAYKEFGFVIEKVVGIGYFPFWGIISRIFCRLDKPHAHLLILKARKV